jgi:hypothetical protein
MTFIGFKVESGLLARKEMNSISCDIAAKRTETGTSTIVFVQSPKETCAMAQSFSEGAHDNGQGDLFISSIEGELIPLHGAAGNICRPELRALLLERFTFPYAGLGMKGSSRSRRKSPLSCSRGEGASPRRKS